MIDLFVTVWSKFIVRKIHLRCLRLICDQRNLADEKNVREIEILWRRIRVASQSLADAAVLDAILIRWINSKLARKRFKSF